LSQSVVDFSLTPGSGSGGGPGSGSGSVTTQTAAPGGAAVYPLNIIPSTGILFPSPILLTVSGTPPGATAAIAPASWTQVTATTWTFPANTQIPAMTLTIQLPPASAGLKKDGPASRVIPPILWGVLLLPFAFRLRRAGKRLRGFLFTLGLTAAVLGALSALSGCVSGNGFFGQKPSTYTVTVTATSGALTRSTKVTLNVE
jgi:hypothetical protein